MKTITFVYPQMVMGGAEKVLIRLIEQIDRKNYTVNAFLMKRGGELEHSIPDDVKVTYASTVSPFKALNRGGVRSAFKELYYRLRIRSAKSYEKKSYYSYLAIENKRISTDCAICFSHFNFLSICTTAYSQAKKKVLWIHSFFRTDMNKKMYEKVLREFDAFCCVSMAVKEEFDRLFPQYAGKSIVVYNLIDKEQIICLSNEKVKEALLPCSLLTIARLSTEKGQYMVPAITRKLLDDGYDINWYLIGSGPLEEEIVKQIKNEQVDNHVFLLGTKDNPFPYLKQCDIYVQPTFMEGFCTTTNEARVLCKPVVTTDIPSMREQFENGVNGVITEYTEEGLYNGIKTLLKNPGLRRKFSLELSKLTFDNNVELKKLYKIIDE